MLSLLAWGDLETEDNAGERHAIKAMELSKLPTRGWEPKLMADLSPPEKAELDAFERDLTLRGASTRPLTADAAVSGMSKAEKYDWLCDELQSAAADDGCLRICVSVRPRRRRRFTGVEEGKYW